MATTIDNATLTVTVNEDIKLTFVSGSSNRYDMKLPAKRTAIFTSPSISGSDGGAGFGSFVSFDSMKATADTSSVDLELFVAST